MFGVSIKNNKYSPFEIKEFKIPANHSRLGDIQMSAITRSFCITIPVPDPNPPDWVESMEDHLFSLAPRLISINPAYSGPM